MTMIDEIEEAVGALREGAKILRNSGFEFTAAKAECAAANLERLEPIAWLYNNGPGSFHLKTKDLPYGRYAFYLAAKDEELEY